MKIKRDSIIVDVPLDISHATTFMGRLKGLMFLKTPLVSSGLYLAPCNSIHMFFMSFPIDAVFLTPEMKVVKTVSRLKPWKSTANCKEAYSVIELPAGTIDLYTIRINDIIEF